MFKRGDVVQHTTERWIGVVTLDGKDGLIVKWFEGRAGGGLVDRTLVTPIDGYEFEAALALGDTAKALELYRTEQQRTADWQKHFHPLLDKYGAEHMAWIAGSIAGMVATGQFDPQDAIRHWERPQALFGKPIVYTELTDAAKVDGQILRVIQPGEVTIKPRFKKPTFGYRVQYVAQDGLTRIGRITADSDEEALQVFAEMVSGATDLKVVWSIPLADADGSVW